MINGEKKELQIITRMIYNHFATVKNGIQYRFNA